MKLDILDTTADSVRAGYDCPCGCRPSVTYERAGSPAHEGCCCGNEFAVGPDASRTLGDKGGYRRETAAFEAPWGEKIAAAWLIGPSVHADESHGHHDGDGAGAAHGHDHGAHHEGPERATEVDPVCGMSVVPQTATAQGLRSTYKGRDFYFCGRGCKLEFEEDPERYLDPAYVPSM